jgi:predicted DNA-binding transcriptional regulator AlpA
MDQLLTLTEVLALVGVTYSTILRWRNAGTFPEPHNGRGKKLFWTQSSIENWMNRQPQPVSSPIIITPKKQRKTDDTVYQAARAALERHRKVK